MGFWSFLFGDIKQTRVEDEYFGSLLLMDYNDPKKDYFQGTRLFTPINKEVGLAINGGLPGPTAAQKAFYQKVEERYRAFIPGMQELITDEVRNWKPEFIIQDFTQEFWPVYLHIPAIEKPEQELDWEISFETFHDQNHTFTIYMRGFSPDYIHIDG